MILERSCYEGALGFLVLQIWLSFGSVLLFWHLKGAVFQFLCPVWFAGFLQCSLWVSVFVNNNGGFLDFSVHCILQFF